MHPPCTVCGKPIDPDLPPEHPAAITRTPTAHSTDDEPHLAPAHTHCARPDPLVLHPTTRHW